jgi:hypothetical protein
VHPPETKNRSAPHEWHSGVTIDDVIEVPTYKENRADGQVIMVLFSVKFCFL